MSTNMVQKIDIQSPTFFCTKIAKEAGYEKRCIGHPEIVKSKHR